MKRLDIITINNIDDLSSRLPFYYISAQYNKILCVTYNLEKDEIKYNLRDPDLICELDKIFTHTFFKNKYGTYQTVDLKLFFLVDWSDKKLNALYSIVGVINDSIVRIDEMSILLPNIPKTEYIYIASKENLDKYLINSSDQDLFICDSQDNIEIYNYKIV